MIVLRPPLLCKGWGGHPLRLSWVQFSTDGSPLALWLYSSEQYSVHRFSICRSSVRHFPERSWTVVAFPCFTVPFLALTSLPNLTLHLVVCLELLVLWLENRNYKQVPAKPYVGSCCASCATGLCDVDGTSPHTLTASCCT